MERCINPRRGVLAETILLGWLEASITRRANMRARPHCKTCIQYAVLHYAGGFALRRSAQQGLEGTAWRATARRSCTTRPGITADWQTSRSAGTVAACVQLAG